MSQVYLTGKVEVTKALKKTQAKGWSRVKPGEYRGTSIPGVHSCSFRNL